MPVDMLVPEAVSSSHKFTQRGFVERLVGKVDRELDEDYLRIAGFLLANMSIVLGEYAHQATFEPSTARVFPSLHAPVNASTAGWWDRLVKEVLAFCEKGNQAQIADVLTCVFQKMGDHVITRARSPRSSQLMMRDRTRS